MWLVIFFLGALIALNVLLPDHTISTETCAEHVLSGLR